MHYDNCRVSYLQRPFLIFNQNVATLYSRRKITKRCNRESIKFCECDLEDVPVDVLSFGKLDHNLILLFHLMERYVSVRVILAEKSICIFGGRVRGGVFLW